MINNEWKCVGRSTPDTEGEGGHCPKKIQTFFFLQPYDTVHLYIQSMVYTDLPHQHLIDEDPQPPPVHTAGVIAVCQHLWSQELWCATKG